MLKVKIFTILVILYLTPFGSLHSSNNIPDNQLTQQYLIDIVAAIKMPTKFQAKFLYKRQNPKKGVADYIEGMIWVKDNKYRLNLEDQIIVSDGKTIWNYSPSLQELQICDEIATTPEVNMDTFSPIQILQLYQHGFIPHEGYSTIIAQEHCHIIKFRSTSKKTNIKHLQLYIDSKSCQIKSIELEEKDQSLHLFDIMELTILENLTDHDFTFSIPLECKEIIDLR